MGVPRLCGRTTLTRQVRYNIFFYLVPLAGRSKSSEYRKIGWLTSPHGRIERKRFFAGMANPGAFLRERIISVCEVLGGPSARGHAACGLSFRRHSSDLFLLT
jgi:hypothetical protein